MEDWNDRLRSAALSGDIEDLRLSIQKGAYIDHQDSCGRTALIFAVWGGRLDVTQLLLDKGCNRDIADNYGCSALMKAVQRRHLDVTRLLLVSGCNTDITDRDGYTALHHAAGKRQLLIVRCLVEQGGINPMKKTLKGKTPYDIAKDAEDGPYKEVMGYLQTVMSGMKDEMVPADIRLMAGKRSIDLYLKLLESGSEKKRDIRLVVVGKQGAGKTSFIRRLFGVEDITDVTSTNGIEIHTTKCKAMSDDCIWNKLDGTNVDTETSARLYKQYEKTIEASVEEGAHQPVQENTPSTSFDESETVTQLPQIMSPSVTTGSQLEPPVTTESQVIPPVNSQQRDQAKMDYEAMLKYNVDLHDKEEYATLLIWDFAGDEEFYHTHQTFLSQDAIYLVVTKLNEADDQKSKEMFQLWMNSIHCYCSTTEVLGSIEEKNKSLHPPVILVGTHKDKVEASEEVKLIRIFKLLAEVPCELLSSINASRESRGV